MNTDNSRRKLLKRLIATTTWCGLSIGSATRSQMSEIEKSDSQERMKRAFEEDAKEVDQLYSAKPIHVFLGSHEYLIPANYFGPKEESSSDIFVADGYFGFHLFLPDFNGYTKTNWKDPFDHRKISVLDISIVDKSKVVRFTDGHTEHISPAAYDEPHAQFQNILRGLEEQPSFHVYGLDGYRPSHSNVDVIWTGKRSNGEFFFFKSDLGPGDPPQAGLINPLCDVRFYSEKEDLHIAYHYSNDHLAKWREIDDAIWEKLHKWKIK